MTPKERWKAAVSRKGLDRLPLDYWGTPETTSKLMQALGCKDEEALWRALDIDKMHYAYPELKDPFEGQREGADVWGVKYVKTPYPHGEGSYDEAVFHPLASAKSAKDIENYAWPKAEWWDQGTVKARALQLKHWPVQGGGSEPFYLYSYMRGLEQAMEDMLENPGIIEAALERIFQIHHSVIEGALKAAQGAIDVIYVAEDLGSQEALLFGPASFRRFLKGRMRAMTDLAHKYGALAFHHDDGAIRPLIPELIESGIDILNPIQWRCPGMGIEALKRDFGRQLCFHGAVDNQQTLPFGSPEDVRAEVRRCAQVLGSGGGYIMAPCHNMQPITPIENALALYDEARKIR